MEIREGSGSGSGKIAALHNCTLALLENDVRDEARLSKHMLRICIYKIETKIYFKFVDRYVL